MKILGGTQLRKEMKEMFKRALFVVVLVLVMVSMAHANAIITLTSLTPENSVGGYLPGTVVDFQVDINQDTGIDIYLEAAQLDFAASDPKLTFLGDFSFDIGSLNRYITVTSYPRVGAVCWDCDSDFSLMLKIPASGSLTLGTGQIQLPTDEGEYLLDALNADTSDTTRGAQIGLGFPYTTTWASWNELITGDPLALKVVPKSSPVPEPATMLLLWVGIIGLAGFRRKFKE